MTLGWEDFKNQVSVLLYIFSPNLSDLSFYFSQQVCRGPINTFQFFIFIFNKGREMIVHCPKSREQFLSHERDVTLKTTTGKKQLPSFCTLLRKKHFSIIKSPTLKCTQCWDRSQIVRMSAQDASTEPQKQIIFDIKTKRAIKILS